MKFQLIIEEDQKKIRIVDDVSFGDLVEALDKLLPNELWKEFTIEKTVEVVKDYSNPIIIEKNSKWWEQGQPYRYPWDTPSVPVTPQYPGQPVWIYDPDSQPIYQSSSEFKSNLNSGTYNLDIIL